MQIHRALLALACCAAGMLGTLKAHGEDGAVVLSRSRALTLGAEHGPAAREAAAPLRAAAAVRDASRALLSYAPRATLFAGRRTGAFGSGLELGGGLGQELSLRGLGSRRSEMATAIGRAAHSELDRARLEAAAVAVLAWVDLLEAQELMRVRTAAREDAQEIARVARARSDRGVGPPSESTLAAAEVGVAELGERGAEGSLFEARAELQYAVGLPPSTPVAAEGELNAIGDIPPVTSPASEHPAEAAARTRTALARADAKLARAQATPTLGLGVNYSREGTGEQLMAGTLTFPLPILDPSRFDAARHEMTVAASEAQTARVRAEIARDVAIADHERLHAREVSGTLATKVLVPLRESVRLARAAYVAGTQDATGFLLVRQRLVAAEEQLARSSADVHRADVRYELARGTLLAKVMQ